MEKKNKKLEQLFQKVELESKETSGVIKNLFNRKNHKKKMKYIILKKY